MIAFRASGNLSDEGGAMQLIEQTGFATRSAVLTLSKRGCDVRFVLLPMLHLGSPAYFQAVRSRLAECDVVIVEGVAGRRARLLTLAYRIGGRLRRGGLVAQRDALDLSTLPGEIIRPDLGAAEFARGWKKVALRLRWTVIVLAPVFGAWMALVGPERALSRNLELDDLPSRDETETADTAFDEALLGSRDRNLCRELVRLAHSPPRPAGRTVGVCWGAGHMRAVIDTLLTQLGYRVVDATWFTVF